MTDVGEYHMFFDVHGDGDFAAFEQSMAGDHTAQNISTLEASDSVRMYRLEVTVPEKVVVPKATELGIRVMNVEDGDAGWIVDAYAPTTDAIREFKRYCENDGVEVTVNHLYRRFGGERPNEYGLTDEQSEVLQASYRMGYFREPRTVSLQDVADELGISSSAASGRLRRAITTLLGNTVCADDDIELEA